MSRIQLSPKKIISILGATIIFVTFLAKEAKRDHLKELADAIDSAEATFINGEEHRHMDAMIEHFRDDFIDFSQDPTKPLDLSHLTFIGTVDQAPFVELSKYQSSIKTAERLYISIERLSDDLPKSDDRAKNLMEVKQKIDDFKPTLDALIQRVDELVKQKVPGRQIGQQLSDQFAQVDDADDAIWASLRGQSDDTFKEAEPARKAKRGDYEFWTVVFYILYCFGAVVGLIGILLEDDKKVVEDLEDAVG